MSLSVSPETHLTPPSQDLMDAAAALSQAELTRRIADDLEREGTTADFGSTIAAQNMMFTFPDREPEVDARILDFASRIAAQFGGAIVFGERQ